MMTSAKSGSVMLEFVLVLPILLLLFGGTLMTYDVLQGQVQLQHSNRNLAWLSNDRYDTESKIHEELYNTVTNFYAARNIMEAQLGGDSQTNFWNFGIGQETPVWGHSFMHYKDGYTDLRVRLEDGKDDSGWYRLSSGNMRLEMAHLSSAYIGAVAISSVMWSDESNALYKASYELTRAHEVNNGRVVARAANHEALIVRRQNRNEEDKVRDSLIDLDKLGLFDQWEKATKMSSTGDDYFPNVKDLLSF